MTLAKYAELVEQVAGRLAGRRVLVRNQAPYIRGAVGICLKTQAGAAVVDVDPALSDSEALGVLLHELAHIKADWASMPANNWADLPPASVTPLPGHYEQNAAKPHETAADKQAAAWLEYARRHATTNDIPGQLQALRTWLEPEYQTIIDRAVKLALAKAKR